uniref:Uncharacterized protein n=1 Tax=Arundo donax TaxID=35708 RepID=A0A0A9DSU2_ARUDO
MLVKYLHMVVFFGRIKFQPHRLHHGLLHIIQTLIGQAREERLTQLFPRIIFPCFRGLAECVQGYGRSTGLALEEHFSHPGHEAELHHLLLILRRVGRLAPLRGAEEIRQEPLGDGGGTRRV